MTLILLLALHHFADTSLQPSWLITNKKKHWFAVYEHVMVYSLAMTIGFWFIGEYQSWIFTYFLIGHFIIDLYKYQYAINKDKYWLIYPDQLLHYLQIIVLYWYLR